MGKGKSKKSATKVAVAPDAAATKPLNKGKREAEEATGNQQVPAKKQKQDVAALKQAIAKMKAEAKNPNNTKAESNSEGDADADDSGLDDETKVTAVSSKGENDASDGKSGDESGDKSDEMPKVAEAEEDGSSEEEGSEEEISESEEGDKKAPKPNVKKAGKTPSTPQAAATGGKTLFMGNMPSSVKESDVEEFFKDAGEIAEVRLASNREGKFKGFGHVEFATVEAAQEALQLNGGDFLGRQIKLDMAREKGAYTPASTPASGNENSNQKGGKAQGQTVYVRGFDTSDGEEQVRSALEKHFGSCGDIHRVSIPQKDGGLKGMAYVEFSFSDCIAKALELNGSKLGGAKLTVEEAKPKESSGHRGGRGRGRSDGGGRFSGGRGRFGGGGRSGGRFGEDSGGRFGGGGRRGGRRGGRGRGRY